MLPCLAYLAVTNTFALLRLLPMSERDKDIEILALRHQLLVLQRQVGKTAFTDTGSPGARRPAPPPPQAAAKPTPAAGTAGHGPARAPSGRSVSGSCA